MKNFLCAAAALCLATLLGTSHALDLKGLKDMVGGGKKQEPASGGTSADTISSGVSAVAGLLKEESVDEELEVGKVVASQVLGAAKLHPDAKIQTYVNSVGRHVASQSERPDLPWAFGVVDTPSINAFAAPGGFILVTKGLFDLFESEDELAAVLGHEIAHVIRKHHFGVVKKQKLVEFGTKAVSGGNNDELAKKMSGLVGQMMARGLDKSAEYEADRDGMVLAARAGYDSSALISVLDKLDQKARSDNLATKLLVATHPAPSDRRAELAKNVTAELEDAAVPSQAKGRIATVR